MSVSRPRYVVVLGIVCFMALMLDVSSSLYLPFEVGRIPFRSFVQFVCVFVPLKMFICSSYALSSPFQRLLPSYLITSISY